MSKNVLAKYIIAVVVLLALFVFGASQWQYSKYKLENEHRREVAVSLDNAKEGGFIEFKCFFTNIVMANCLVEQPNTSGVDEHTKADLKAQQDMAEWSFLTMVISCIGVILSALAVAFTGWAAWEAAKAAEAAVGATNSTAAALRFEYRPKLRVAFISSDPANGARFKGGEQIKFCIDVVNYGGHKARVIESHFRIFIDKKLPMIRPYQAEARNDFFGNVDIDRGDCERREYQPIDSISDEKIQEIENGTLNLYIMGYVRYIDCEDKIKRRTMFCRIYNAKTDRYDPVEDPDYVVEN